MQRLRARRETGTWSGDETTNGGGRYFIYRPPLGSFAAIRSGLCGQDLRILIVSREWFEEVIDHSQLSGPREPVVGSKEGAGGYLEPSSAGAAGCSRALKLHDVHHVHREPAVAVRSEPFPCGGRAVPPCRRGSRHRRRRVPACRILHAGLRGSGCKQRRAGPATRSP